MNKKDKISLIAGTVLAMSLAAQGFALPLWAAITVGCISAGAAFVVSFTVGRKANLKKKSPEQIKKENEL